MEFFSSLHLVLGHPQQQQEISHPGALRSRCSASLPAGLSGKCLSQESANDNLNSFFFKILLSLHLSISGLSGGEPAQETSFSAHQASLIFWRRMCLSHSDDGFQAGPVHHALGRAQDVAAPPSVLRRGRGVDDTDQNTRTNRVLSAWLSVPSLCREERTTKCSARGGTGQGLGMSPGRRCHCTQI